MNEAKFCVPGIPPSVNNYVRHTRQGRHYKTTQAESFCNAVAHHAGKLRGRKLEVTDVEIVVWMGYKQRGDLDNFPKTCLDALVRAGVMRSDSTVTRLLLEKHRAVTPQTDIYIRWE